jgi:hypothetical protein
MSWSIHPIVMVRICSGVGVLWLVVSNAPDGSSRRRLVESKYGASSMSERPQPLGLDCQIQATGDEKGVIVGHGYGLVSQVLRLGELQPWSSTHKTGQQGVDF